MLRRASIVFVLGLSFLRAQSIVPAPVHCVVRESAFVLGPGTKIVAAAELRPLGERLRACLRPATALPLPVVDKGAKDSIQLILDPKSSVLGDEGYRLEAGKDHVEIRAFKAAGVFYGIQTLRQLLPTESFREAPVAGIEWKIPSISIDDSPRFPWRGSHLDTGRHFMPKIFIKRHLDLMALHKLNVFHWHLTEDQGWRLKIKKYPKLTEVGAWRKETVIDAYMRVDRPNQMRFDGVPHGGFYTQEDAKEIVRYAAERFITVVPEIEMPGHSSAAVAAYPELGNFPDHKVEVITSWGVFEDVFNVEDRTQTFLKDVLDEVMAIFPSKFIHVGGDECPKAQWARSEGALARMKQIGLVPANTTLADLQNYKNEKGQPAEHPALHKLQSWFIQQMDVYLASKGRRLIGWDEILEGGLAPGAAVMSWRGEEGGIQAANAGHDVVMAPYTHTYLDNYQSQGTEPFAIGGLCDLAKVYSYEPIPGAIAADQTKHVLGAQAQLWTEYVPTPEHAEYMLWPRLAAMAEVVWSPKEGRSYGDFLKRMKIDEERLEVLGVNHRALGH